MNNKPEKKKTKNPKPTKNVMLECFKDFIERDSETFQKWVDEHKAFEAREKAKGPMTKQINSWIKANG